MKVQTDIVLFDNDGTLFNSGKGVLQAVQEACIVFRNSRSVPMEIPSLKRIAHLTGSKAEEFFPALLPEGYKHLAMELREVSLEREIEAIKLQGELFEGITETLQELKKKQKKLAVITNAGIRYVRTVAEKFNYDEIFHMIACPEMNGIATKTELVRFVCRELGGGKFVVVGDKLADMSAAKQNYGIAIFAAYGFGTAEDALLADFSVETPLQIAELLT